ncbi:MAG: 5-oxoprolinase [Desulfosporosinus sp. BRH_c37]|nr:MAG: 5-oxoprolinase [Desulfosporosinus sp. BRH_c37]
MYRVGIDVGGTFTDFLLIDEVGQSKVYKTLTTPKSPTEGVVNGLELMAKDLKISFRDFLQQVTTIVHGTTITTNATLTGDGANTGFITTKGFRDALNMRRGLRAKQYSPKQSPPAELVPRYLVQAVEERVNFAGQEVTPLNEVEVRQAAKLFIEQGVEAIAVSLLFSFFNPEHEQRIKEILQEEMPDVYVSLSSEILPQVRLYERNSTTALNAYVGPPLFKYLTNLLARFNDEGFKGTLLIMQSNGGVMSPEVAKRFASNTLLSGPAAGPAAGIFYSESQEADNIITVDMGGTSFDICLIKNKQPGITNEGQVGGYRIASPMLDIHTIGAGGGSIAWVDAGGMLRVGPKSASSEPGPVCYGRGGKNITTTDANLILGYLDPKFFHGGTLDLDVQATKDVLAELAQKLGMDPVATAAGVYKIVNMGMADGVREVSVRRGHDPREFALVVAGGAGPIHAAEIATELGISSIIVPRESSVFCAAGMLISDLKHDYVRTYHAPMESASLDKITEFFDDMAKEALAVLGQEGVSSDRIQLKYAADIRYIGQSSEVEVVMSSNKLEEELTHIGEAFHRTHNELYGYAMPGAALEVVNLRLTAIGIVDKPNFNKFAYQGTESDHALKTKRKAYFEGGYQEVQVYDGLKLNNGNIVIGPAIIEQPTTTIIVTPDFNIKCDDFNNYVMYPKLKR